MNKRISGGALLVAGTTVGAVTLVLPAMISALGMVLGTCVFLSVWVVMLYSGLYVLEALFCFDKPVSYITLSQFFFGPQICAFIGLLFLCLLYSLMAAYLTGGADILSSLDAFHGIKLHWLSFLWVCVGFVCLYLGQRVCHLINRWAMYFLLASFLVLIPMMLWFSDLHIQTHVQSQLVFRNTIIIVTAFGYQIVLPSLRHYMGADVQSNVKSVIYGSASVALLYILWSNTLLAVIGGVDMAQLAHSSSPVIAITQILIGKVDSVTAFYCTEIIFATAILSSFVGVSVSLFHFILDGIGGGQRKQIVLLAAVGTMLPPWLFTYFYPNGFVSALEYSGLFVCALNIILPLAMASLRRWRRISSEYEVCGGWWPISIIIILTLMIILGRYWSLYSLR